MEQTRRNILHALVARFGESSQGVPGYSSAGVIVNKSELSHLIQQNQLGSHAVDTDGLDCSKLDLSSSQLAR